MKKFSVYRNKYGKFLVLAGMGGKEQQFQALVSAFSSNLYRYAYWLCGDPSRAEDRVQETLTRAWKALDSIRDEAALKRWLFTILQRENARRFERQHPDTVDIDSVEALSLSHDCPEHDAERCLVHNAILQLKPEYREPLAMQIVGGFTYEEIASALGIDKGAVVMRLYRGKNKLSELLNKSDQLRSIDRA